MTLPRMRKPRPPKRYPRRSWSAQEDDYLAKWHNVKPAHLVARALKRTVQSVSHRASKLGLSYVGSRLSMTMDVCADMLGITRTTMIHRLTDKRESPIPHRRIGRYVEIDEVDFFEWLNDGNILAFDRTKIDPRLHRMYDAWRRKTITSTEVYRECVALGEALRAGKGKTFDRICVIPINQSAYYKDDVYAWAYQWGHVIGPDASPRFQVIRTAWDTEYMFKYDVVQVLGEGTVSRRITPHCPSSTKYVYKRSELCARLAELGHHDLAKRWRSTPIPWQELMRDYERKAKR